MIYRRDEQLKIENNIIITSKNVFKSKYIVIYNLYLFIYLYPTKELKI